MPELHLLLMHTHLGELNLFFLLLLCTIKIIQVWVITRIAALIRTQPFFLFFLILPCLHRTCSVLDSYFDTKIKSTMWFSSSCHNLTSYSCRRCCLSVIFHLEFGRSPPERSLSFNEDLFHPTACRLSWPNMVGFEERSVTSRKQWVCRKRALPGLKPDVWSDGWKLSG